MQLCLAAGTRLTLVTGGRQVPVRTLADLDLDLDAVRPQDLELPVMAPTGLVDSEGRLELGTATGLVSLQVHVVRCGDGLALRLGSELRRDQRREAVRGDVALDVLIALPDGAGGSYRVVRGRTLNVSAGGLLVRLATEPGELQHPGHLLDAELTLPGDRHVSAVLQVVDVDQRGVRTAFAEIEPAAQELLVRMVFARERAELARRRLLRDSATGTDGTSADDSGGEVSAAGALAQVLPMTGPRS